MEDPLDMLLGVKRIEYMNGKIENVTIVAVLRDPHGHIVALQSKFGIHNWDNITAVTS